MRRLIAATLLLLAACAHRMPPAAIALPPLRLAPAALGGELAAQQRLQFRFGAQQRELDALLEVDAGEVRLAVQAMGQSGVRLQWDGKQLHEQRAPWLPAAVRSERVLDDLQFSLWPIEAIRAALPPGWSVEDDGRERRLVHEGEAWLRVTRLADRLQLVNRAEGYQLDIQTLGGDMP